MDTFKNKHNDKYDLIKFDRLIEKFKTNTFNRITNISDIFRRKQGINLIMILGLILFLISFLLCIFTGHVRIILPYTENDKNLSVMLNSDMKGYIVLYFYIQNFYSNMRSYIDSQSEYFVDNCSDIVYIQDVYKIRPKATFPELKNFSNNDLFRPCGLQSATYFNDEIELYKMNGEKIEIDVSEFTFTPLSFLYFPPLDKSWTDGFTNYRLQHWYLYPFTSNILLPIGHLKLHTLPTNMYSVKLVKNLWPSTLFRAKKNIVIMSVKPFGSSQVLLSIILVIFGIILILIALSFRIALHKNKFYSTFTEEEVLAIKNLWLSKTDQWKD